MEHLESQLGAAEISLSADVLDQIDELVPPGTMVDPNDSDFNPAVADRSEPSPPSQVGGRGGGSQAGGWVGGSLDGLDTLRGGPDLTAR